jgi:hypothetical protein
MVNSPTPNAPAVPTGVRMAPYAAAVSVLAATNRRRCGTCNSVDSRVRCWNSAAVASTATITAANHRGWAAAVARSLVDTAVCPSCAIRTTAYMSYQPLYPFASLADAQAWQAADRSGGHQPWHADAGATAIAFSSGWLGFNEIDTVTNTRTGADGAHIGVGYRDPNGRLRTAAVLHLVRFGTDPDSPWEVVGSDDPASFSLDTPAYGSPVTSPITVGGHIVGVDENIKVTVHRLASQAPVGTHCCTPAGMATPTGTDWAATVSFTAAPGDVLTIVAQTGGHLQAVERFAIQGVHT